MKARTALAAVTVLLALTVLTPIGRAKPARKILQWGWDEPDTAHLRRHLAEMERSPFQDFSPVLANLRLAADLARAGQARGILLDVEQYQGPVFEFRAQPFSLAYGWDGYAAQVRRRGREVMAALQACSSLWAKAAPSERSNAPPCEAA